MDKAHILDEIKRTAAANGGIPLGCRRFFSETGIKQTDWCGVHWARWSEALREAGFAPSQLTAAYDKAELLDRFTQLALEIGRLPAKGDLRLKARKDPEFPHDTTFARLGSKAELVAQLLEHCRRKEGLEAVIRWWEEYAARRRDRSEGMATVAVGTMGFVYLVKMSRFYKIGKTNAVGRREYELRMESGSS